MAARIKPKTIEQPRKIVYKVLARCIRQGNEIYYAGDEFLENTVPEWIRREAKDVEQVISDYEKKCFDQIAMNEKLLRGYDKDKLQHERINKQILELKEEIKKIRNGNIDIEQVYIVLGVPVIKMVD